MAVNGLRSGSIWRGAIAVTVAGVATLAAAGTANAGNWKKGRGYYVPYGAPAYVVTPAPVYYAPAPVYYAPPPRPVVVYPAPVAYTPAPVYTAPAYYAPPGVSIGVNLPLR